MPSSDFTVRFWGVRGSIACSGPRTARYGGNTSSLEVRCGARMLLFDAGTGLRYLGNSLSSSTSIDADLFLTHTWSKCVWVRNRSASIEVELEREFPR